jgi:glycosyltransferase involved in cell wall biosynthesis
MRLALVHYTAAPIPGGVESILAAHERLLREAGHDVVVVAGRGDAAVVPEVDSRHPDVERLALRLAEGHLETDEFNRLRATILARLRPLLDGRQAVIAHNVMTMPFNLPLAAALGDAGLPLVAWTHDIAWTNPHYEAYRREGYPWSILREPLDGCRYVAISEVRRRELVRVMGLPDHEVPVVPNGIDQLALWSVSAATRTLAERAGFTAADPMLLVPVRLTRRKRLELALETARLLAPRHPDLHMVVSGPLGPHSADNRAYWRELQERRSALGLEGIVSFLHEQAGPDGVHPVDERVVADLYRMADAVLLPSESEGFGLPVLESALVRAPLVCADLPVLRELGAGAIFVPPAAGAAELAAAVESALGLPAAEAKRRVARLYSWSRVAGMIERVVGAAVAG